MQRRKFSQAAAAMAAFGWLASPQAQPAGKGEARASRPAFGTNLSGMEWAKPGLRHGLSSAPNIHFTVPRKTDVAYLASCGFTQNRLPIQWELLQPMLPGTVANAAARALIGEPGAFHAGYASHITGLLDAHGASGMRCIIDLHNYARYQDFVYQPDGSVIGLRAAPDPLLRPYTTDKAQIRQRIFALEKGATLTPALFADVWRRAAAMWKGHPGLGGYGLMNEPHELPERGGTVESKRGREDLMILPVFMQAAIDAIRAIDKDTPIYVGGNEWSGAASIAAKNPGYPLSGDGLVYEVHAYLDRRSTGHAFDWDQEASVGKLGGGQGTPITRATGRDRLQVALDWARAKDVKLALGEIGMPVDDPRWAESFRQTLDLALKNGIEVYSWMGGNHWPIRSHALAQVPGWYQNQTVEPLASGVMKAAAGIAQATLFDDGPGFARAGTPVTLTVQARGHLARPLRIAVKVEGGGRLDTEELTLPAGANTQVAFTYTPADNRVAVLRYAVIGQPGVQAPPPRKIFSLTDPVAYAATRLEDAALALMARHGACKWDLADAWTDYMLGKPAAAGQAVRAVADSGYGSSAANPMEMVNWTNLETPAMGRMSLPILRVAQGRKSSAHGPDTFGLWCKKAVPVPGMRPRPVNRVPYNIEDSYFAVAAVSIAASDSHGLVFQASHAEANHACELGFEKGQPLVRWEDARGQKVTLNGPDPLASGKLTVLTFTCAPEAQALRINSVLADSANARFAPSPFSQMLLGWGFRSYYPQEGFSGQIHAVITGKGVPSASELAVLERYLRG